jgi:hypothetical protein
MTEAGLSKAIPILASLDMARTLDFCRTVLGFEVRHDEAFSYGMAWRDDVELQFWACNDRSIAENTSCYIRVKDIAALRALYRLPDVHAPAVLAPDVRGLVRTAPIGAGITPTICLACLCPRGMRM